VAQLPRQRVSRLRFRLPEQKAQLPYRWAEAQREHYFDFAALAPPCWAAWKSGRDFRAARSAVELNSAQVDSAESAVAAQAAALPHRLT
jgi:hypothetical protein